MRQQFVTLLVALFAAATFQFAAVEGAAVNSDCGSNKTHNFFYGARSYNDHLLYIDHIDYKSKWMRVISLDKDYPQPGQTPFQNISYIEVLDNRTDGSGGCVYLKKGGVGSNFVTINFKTQRNHGMNFVVHIYGR